MIDAIIRLLKKHDLTPSGDKEIREWYDYVIHAGLARVAYEDNELVGVIDWIHLPHIPESKDEAREMYAVCQEGEVTMVLTAVAENKGILRKLIKEAWEANGDCKYVVWHNKKHDKMMVFNNRRQQCLV